MFHNTFFGSANYKYGATGIIESIMPLYDNDEQLSNPGIRVSLYHRVNLKIPSSLQYHYTG